MLPKVLLTILFFTITEALTCWQCINEPSNESCLKNGHPKICAENQRSCQNVVRRGKFGVMMITKRCKQRLACFNNLLFLKELSEDADLRCSNKRRTVCRCCCSTYLCNKATIGCRDFFSTKLPFATTTAPTRSSTTTTTVTTPTRTTTASTPVATSLTMSSPSLTTNMSIATTPLTSSSTDITSSRRTTDDPLMETITTPFITMQSILTANITTPLTITPSMTLPAVTTPFTTTTPLNTTSSIATVPTSTPLVTTPSILDVSTLGVLTRINSTNADNVSTIEFTTIPRDPPDENGTPSCAPPGIPDFGNVSCSPEQLNNGRFLIETDCEYSCDSGFILQGFSFTSCLAIGDSDIAMFDNPPPFCARCEMLEPAKSGNFSCSRTLDSVCTLECDPEFISYPLGVTSTTCQTDASWTQPIPCCLRSCPPDTFTDIIILLDISMSVDENNWEIMRNFVLEFIRLFNIGPGATRFAIIRYNDVIDQEYQILLEDFPDDKESLLKTFSEVPYEAQSHSDTGLVLQYALDTILRTSNGDRRAPNAILVITDSEAYDDETVFENALSLRAEEIATFVIGIVPSLPDRLDLDQLLHLAGSEENFFLLQGFAGLSDNLTTVIAERLCLVRTCESEHRYGVSQNFPP